MTPDRVDDYVDTAFVGAGSGPLAAKRPWLIEVISDPLAHPPISLFDGTLDRQQSSEMAL